MPEFISIRGARTHNLKNLDLDIPRDKLVVITGLSGSGKSSVAFDTLYAEGQRRYAESLSSYARHFLDVLDKPDVDSIEGLSPSIAIEQHSAPANTRSTVGTMTEINDYLRVLFSRAGTPYCPEHDVPLKKSGIHDMVDAVLSEPEGTRVAILAPMKADGEVILEKSVRQWRAKGFTRVRIDGEIYGIDDIPQTILDEAADVHTVEVVIDRLKTQQAQRSRLAESFETAVKLTDGAAAYVNLQNGVEHSFSLRFCCPVCERTMPELTPMMFSFNNALGACPRCQGNGTLEDFDPNLVIKDENLSLREGAVAGCTPQHRSIWADIVRASVVWDFSVDTPFGQLPEWIRKYVLYGQVPKDKKIDQPFMGIMNQLAKHWKSARSEAAQMGMRILRSTIVCPDCEGHRFRSEVKHVYVGEPQNRVNLIELQNMPLTQLCQRLESLTFDETAKQIAANPVEEILKRLRFLIEVGVGYLTLDRSAATLSGGELQRIRLAGQIGAGLTGVTYVLDEPTIGLHQRDTAKVVDMFKRLTQAGNSVIVVEHDPDVIRSSDWIVDMGPGAGVHGGEVVASGTPEEIQKNPLSRTGRYLAKGFDQTSVIGKKVDVTEDTPMLILKGAKGHNLKNITCRFPIGALTVVTGVSGSGKSSLINDTLARFMKKRLHRAKQSYLPFDSMEGLEFFDKIIEVDQSPIGKTPRSNPATYTGLMTSIRDVFAQTPRAQEKGYGPGRFSFNSEEGSCEACKGDGQLKIEMGFLPPVYVRCPTCRGRRFNRETLEVKYKGKSIADVLDMTANEASEFFAAHPTIARKLNTLTEVGLGYIGLGQSAVTFSGGEAQRIKLTEELSRRDTGRTLYVLDEPTTGLHFDDVVMLMKVLRRLTELGNTVVVIEHNMDVIRCADWIIDIGPEGGDQGGEVVFEGKPQDLVDCPQSVTGRYLARELALSDRPKAAKKSSARKTTGAAKTKRTTSAKEVSKKPKKEEI